MKILLIGDVHSSFENIRKLTSFIRSEGIKIDMILLNGDIVNICHPEESQNDLEEFLSVIDSIKGICSNLYYVPGNHDPSSEFQNVRNIHQSIAILDQNIELRGLGGSVKASYTADGSTAFPGYPFESEEQVSESLRKISSTSTNQIIFMTHCGPIKSSTALRDVGSRGIEMGSRSIFEFMQSQANLNRIVFHVHGHTHDGWGMSQLAKIPTINPGALKEGRFAIANLSHIDNSWKFESVSFHLLDLESRI